jgi:predicted ABC-type ATPase
VRLDLVVGPNGAGKSTFVRLVLAEQVRGSVFVNADEIAKANWPDDTEAQSYEAARIAAATRETLIDRRQPFIAETVFSHPSKLDLIETARRTGYFVALHVVMVPEDLAVARVAARVAAGGHPVPEDKVRQRWHRLWHHVADAVGLVDDATFWDNATHDGPHLVAEFFAGLPAGAPRWPPWTPAVLTDRWRI